MMGSNNITIMRGDINQFTFEKVVLIHNLIYVLDGTFQVKFLLECHDNEMFGILIIQKNNRTSIMELLIIPTMEIG